MDEVGTNGYSYMYQWFTGSGNRAAVMSPALLAKYDQERDLRFPLVTKNYQSGWEMRKYISGDISSTLNRTCEVGYPIYRYSDMILLQAEAQARQSKWEEALDLVKPIRTRAGLETPLRPRISPTRRSRGLHPRRAPARTGRRRPPVVRPRAHGPLEERHGPDQRLPGGRQRTLPDSFSHLTRTRNWCRTATTQRVNNFQNDLYHETHNQEIVVASGGRADRSLRRHETCKPTPTTTIRCSTPTSR